MAEALSQRLRESIERAPVIRLGEYDYFVHPLSDGVPAVDPDLLEEVVSALAVHVPPDTDVLLSPEAMGVPLAAALSLKVRRPYMVARKRSYRLPGEIHVPYRTGYGGGDLYINGLRPGQRVVIVDDVLSRGGTLRALAGATRAAGARLQKALVVFTKDHDLAAVGQQLGAPVEALATVSVSDGRMRHMVMS